MKIILITITYPPEIGGAAHLIHGLATSLKAMGHDVKVLTCFPTYNLKDIPDRYKHGFRYHEMVDGIKIERVRIPKISRSSKLGRGVVHFTFGIFLGLLALSAPKPEVAIVFSPPLPLPWFVEIIGKIKHMPVIVNVQDLFPLEAVELGILKNPHLIRFFEQMERQVYQRAAGVTVHSPGNKAHVIARGGSNEKVHVVYNWVDTDLISPGSKTNEFSQKYGLEHKFVVSYAGTMGWAQDMDTIINCANRLREQKNIFFVLVGDGVEKEKAQAKSTAFGLSNILWLPMQPLSVYPEILATSDISLINLHPNLHTPVVPSKLLSIMSAERPVVASLPAESDARRIIKDANCGIYVDAGDAKALADAIRELEGDRERLTTMAFSGRQYVGKHFSLPVCAEELEQILILLKGNNL